jgi:hypothetical protein
MCNFGDVSAGIARSDWTIAAELSFYHICRIGSGDEKSAPSAQKDSRDPSRLVNNKLDRLLQCVGAGFGGADAYDVFEIGDKYLAVTDLAGLGRFDDGVNRTLHFVVVNDYFNFHFGDEVDRVLSATINFGVSLLAAEAADLGDSHAGDAFLRQGVFHIFELEVANNCFNFFHALDSQGWLF